MTTTALITGAGVRLGRAIALALAEAGHDVVLHAHASTAGVEEVARAARGLGRQAWVTTCDLGDEAAVESFGQALARDHERLDVLIHNAGVFEEVPFEQITRARYRRMQAINLEAPFFLTQALLPSLRKAPAPSVVLLADIAGERPMNRYAHYSVSKAGVVMLTKALAFELAPHVRVNAVAPGTAVFPPGFPADAKARVLKRIPLQREGTAADVARAVVFLTQQPYVTGHVLHVDGGRSAIL